ncbi:MAG: hypothetical protein NWP87_08155, partial [Winogradskyella sp.]|nr:hypothetical protein [Winogradskyella sp.]
AQMPGETQQIDVMFETTHPKEEPNMIEFETITSGFAEIPEFEPLEEAQKRESEKAMKSLNDKLKGEGLKIGLNDKLAFIKHLFEGKNEDYDRVISQINTTHSIGEARRLILEMVKPDYNNWRGKEEYEERFIEIVESKFN